MQLVVNQPIFNDETLTEDECANDFTVVQRKRSGAHHDIRCGGIIFDPTFQYILIILNRLSMLGGTPKWGLPKGHLKPDETLFECACREIKEETGLTFNFTDTSLKVKINNTYYYPVTTDMNSNLCPIDSLEICDIRWAHISELHDLNTNRELKKFLTIVSKTIKLARLNNLIATKIL